MLGNRHLYLISGYLLSLKDRTYMLRMGLHHLALLELVLVPIEAVLERFHKLAGNSRDLPDHSGTACSGHHLLHFLIAAAVS